MTKQENKSFRTALLKIKSLMNEYVKDGHDAYYLTKTELTPKGREIFLGHADIYYSRYIAYREAISIICESLGINEEEYLQAGD